MPLRRYGVLKARPIACRQGSGRSPHYHIHAVDPGEDYRVSISVRSKPGPSRILYRIDDRFDHPLLAKLAGLPPGFSGLDSSPGGLALDYVRGGVVSREDMDELACDVPGPDLDFNELLHLWVGRALRDEDAMIYAFGERFGPAHGPDAHFGFRPATGVYNVHMNQGSDPRYAQLDGAWQDGAVLLHFPEITEAGVVRQRARWVAIFVAFASQRWTA
jgi:uncharacterized protein YukJ